ncbi:18352_t:CDS:2, partial [Gigaspora margarita]
MNNVKNRENIYSLLLQEKGSSTKESWDNMVSQYEKSRLKKEKVETISDYKKAVVHTQSSHKDDNLSLKDMQSKTLLQISSNLNQSLPLDIIQITRSIYELTIDNPFSKQNTEKNTSIKSEDVVIETIENK